MKNCSIFTESTPKTFLTLLGVGFFISTAIGEHYNLGLSIPNGFCTVRSEIVFGETGIVQSFFCTLYYSFSFMPKTMKDCSTVNHSIRTSTSAHETSTLQSKLTIEQNAKNQAYAFILSSGLFNKFVEFSRTYHREDQNLHTRIEQLISNN